MAVPHRQIIEDGTGFELAHADTLRFLPELVRDLGGDPDALMREAGIDPAILERPAARVSYRALIRLMELAAERLGCADFGMRLAAVQGGGRVFGPIGVVMRNSATLGEALGYVAAHIHAYSLGAALRLEPQQGGNRVYSAFDILLEGLPGKAQTLEQLLLLSQYNCIDITHGRARVREVLFRHHPLSPMRVYRDYFGCEVRFDQPVDALVFTREDMAAAIAHPDDQQREMATFFIDTNFPVVSAPMHARVRGLVMRHLGVSDCTIERIADELCMHPRTLHRRLKDEARSFEGIKDDVRRDMARYYLERTALPFTRIAEKLGYSETSVLSRSCLRWFGASPRDVRAGLPEPASATADG